MKRKKYICANPLCKKTVERTPHEIAPSGKVFCSLQCSIKTNNLQNQKLRLKVRICLNCGKSFTRRDLYCSKSCGMETLRKLYTVPAEKILTDIKIFYKQNGRVPLKREYKHYKAARSRFGTWNKTIIAAGLNPNPVLFAKKYVANDKHVCDSLSEKIIDDWLFARQVPHKINVPYAGTKMTADFEVNGTLIEFFGLRGQLKSYDRLADKKEQLFKDKHLNVISLYPRDLFPENKLGKRLKSLLIA